MGNVEHVDEVILANVAENAIRVLSSDSDSTVNGEVIGRANQYLVKYFELYNTYIDGVQTVEAE